MGYKVSNNANSLLTAAISPTSTSISITGGTGVKFPTLTGGDTFPATLVDSSNNIEIVNVTGRTGDLLTVVRGQEGTTARSFSVGDRIFNGITAAAFNDKADKADVTAANAALTAHTSSTNAHAAANITYSGNTNLSATNVEDALDELDNEKAGVATNNNFTGSNSFTQPVLVPDDPFNATSWDGNLSVPTKNAIRDYLTSLTSVPTATLIPSRALSAPAGYLACDGSSYSQATYPALWAAIHKEATVSISIATPAVITWNAHGLVNGNPIVFKTTGALPTGLVANTVYYIINSATNTFQLSLTVGGAAINTAGSQSGVHTAFYAPDGVDTAANNFNVPNIPENYALSKQANGTLGTTTVGQVLTHVHQNIYGNFGFVQGPKGSDGTYDARSSTANAADCELSAMPGTGTNIGNDNLAAAYRVNYFIKT